MSSAVVLDTHAALWLMSAGEMTEESRRAIAEARQRDVVFVSAISAWEIAILVSKRRLKLIEEPLEWFKKLLAFPGIGLAALTPEILIASVFLPGNPPADPADRIIAATSRALDVPLITRDSELLSHADAG